MYAVEMLGSYITRGVYTVSGSFHPFGGAVDIIVVEQPDGSFKSSPWYVRFGKFQGVLKAREKEVTINVNGIEANFHMFLDQRGEAYFLREIESEEGESVSYASYSSDEMEDQFEKSRRPIKSKSLDYDGSKSNSVIQFDESNGKIVSMTNSHQSRISGFVFRQRSMEDDGYLKGDNDAEVVRVSSLEGDNDAGVVRVSSLEGDNDAGVVRISSLECADIAADLVETFMLDQSDLEEKLVEISKISRKIDEPSLRNADQDDSAEDVTPEVTSSDSKIADMVEAHPGKKLDEKQASGFGISEEENGPCRVQTFIYCETSESSIMGSDALNKQSKETLHLAPGGPGDVHFCTENLHITAEPLTEDPGNHQAEDLGLGGKHIGCCDVCTHQTNPSSSSIHHDDKANLELSVPVKTSYDMVCVDPTIDLAKDKLKGISSISGFSNSVDQTQDKVHIGKKIASNKSLESVGDSEQLRTKAASIPVSESSEEEQFFFSDVDDFEVKENQGESNFPDAVYEENFVQMNGLHNFENLTENSKIISNPIHITRRHTDPGAEVARLAGSLPNLWSDIDSLGTEDLHHPLSHSLDLKSKSLEWKLQGKNETHYTNSDTANENQSAQGYSESEDTQVLEDIKNGVDNPAVEISLCKHLLYEGMGAEAASQAFEAEKLDIDKFTSLGPKIMKNSRLVVRIGGHYFPWDAAAPIVLGMVAFGSENIFEPRGMIPVDRVEQSLVGDPSKSIVTTSGSWRLWPFPFSRSRSRKAMQPTLNDTRSSDAENASNSNVGTDNNKNEGKVMKKMVKAVTPTSEELASLNLKEGSNAVTFTFSTAMLGKQKVDARIYLWKWNTRIVISDVDGTITKSDVLGQFMPLVGIDWSQNGVAHLFSAIKDNGYQFLYLSARAIAQAYITRQFLVNLKQDGKALPDGPVVISPDGLFPSLFREVIRRAPHEFKIACLEDIKALFPSDCNPFYAGFGNRDTDEISYLKVGIPKGKIFIINPKGEVAVNRLVDTRSYTSLHALLHGMFPAMTSSEQEDFNSWNYWKLPLPDIDM